MQQYQSIFHSFIHTSAITRADGTQAVVLQPRDLIARRTLWQRMSTHVALRCQECDKDICGAVCPLQLANIALSRLRFTFSVRFLVLCAYTQLILCIRHTAHFLKAQPLIIADY